MLGLKSTILREFLVFGETFVWLLMSRAAVRLLIILSFEGDEVLINLDESPQLVFSDLNS